MRVGGGGGGALCRPGKVSVGARYQTEKVGDVEGKECKWQRKGFIMKTGEICYGNVLSLSC